MALDRTAWDNTHTVDPLPESPADTELPCHIHRGMVYLDLINAARFLSALLEPGTYEDELTTDADASYVIDRVRAVSALPVDDGWMELGTAITMTEGGSIVGIDCHVPVLYLLAQGKGSAAGRQPWNFPVDTLRAPVPFGQRASGARWVDPS